MIQKLFFFIFLFFSSSSSIAFTKNNFSNNQLLCPTLLWGFEFISSNRVKVISTDLNKITTINEYYYDVDLDDQKISESDFEKIETRMLEICREKHDFKLRPVSKKEAIQFYTEESNDYKLELINDLNDGEITFCDHSNFTDLCKGPHIPSSGKIKAIKLISKNFLSIDNFLSIKSNIS